MSGLISINFPIKSTIHKYGSGMLRPNLNNAFGEKLGFLQSRYYESIFLCLQLVCTRVSTVDMAQLSRVCNPMMIGEW